MARARTHMDMVLHRILPPGGMVVFAGPETEVEDPRDVGPDRLLVNMTHETWIDLGQPDEVTVTLRPGDALNEVRA